MPNEESRYYYFDFLRVLGALTVIILHVSGQNWDTTDVRTFEWQVLNFWHGSIFRWGVPVFTMISGALFLGRDIPIRKIYSKYILRILSALIFWSFVYAAREYVKSRDIAQALKYFAEGHYHLWYLYMIIGLYMFMPFLKKIAESEQLTKYFLAIVFVFVLVLPEAADLMSLFSRKYGEFAGGLARTFYLQNAGGFAGYFLLGYCLSRAEVSSRAERTIYFLGIAGLIAGMILSVTASLVTGEPNQIFYDTGGRFRDNYGNFTVNCMFFVVAVFVFFRAKFNRPSRLIRALSQYSFGAYLVHDAVIGVVGWYGLRPLAFSPLLSVPVISAVVFVISFAISAVLNHIPVLKKYIV